MKKLMAAGLLFSLFLAACGSDTSDEETAESETETTESTEENNGGTEEETEDTTEEAAETEENTDSEENEDNVTAGTEESLEDGDLIEEDVDVNDLKNSTDGDIVSGDYSVTFLVSSNPELIDVINSAEETDLTVDDVLMEQDSVTTYNTATYLGVYGFTEDTDEPAFSDTVALRGAVDERDGLRVLVDQYDPAAGDYAPHGFGDTGDGETFLFDGVSWQDYSAEAGAEEIMYGLYMNVEPILKELSDTIEVRETEDYYVLYYVGESEAVYDSFGSLFEVEFTNANMDELVSSVFGIINKETDELEHISYISHAPGMNPSEYLQIDVALDFMQYGEYDETGIEKPVDIEGP